MSDGRRIRVLIADDNEDSVLTLTALLEDEGYEVRQARDGRQAMVELAEFDPGAVVADLSMPGMSGWDLARAVRRIGDGPWPLLIAAYAARSRRRFPRTSASLSA